MTEPNWPATQFTQAPAPMQMPMPTAAPNPMTPMPMPQPEPPALKDTVRVRVVWGIIAGIIINIILFGAYEQTIPRYRYMQQTHKAETAVAKQILSTYEGVKTIKFNDYNDSPLGIGMPPYIYYYIDVNGIPGQWGAGVEKLDPTGEFYVHSDDWEPDKHRKLEGTGLAKRKQKIKVTDAMLSRVKITYSYNWYRWY